MSYLVDYAPVAGSELASAAVVLVPIGVLFVLCFVTRVVYAAAAALVLNIIVACAAYGMPFGMALMAAINGALYVSASNARDAAVS